MRDAAENLNKLISEFEKVYDGSEKDKQLRVKLKRNCRKLGILIRRERDGFGGEKHVNEEVGIKGEGFYYLWKSRGISIYAKVWMQLCKSQVSGKPREREY